ncbi:LolA family protein [Desulfoferrobacter suflitae]|uniref:LolA family protein n=1 Tax=Desulfoferrobacter suflitae TaxID=2865782 RepID=UPI002164606A|nr:outer membrane lipoprotein carrier protein LolA [Desulfoferrobacter suflitae]MCK8602642.1 outer membrane lipoprotein carrier protein LolA [Desulfoferrobacter suflitae]
MKKHRLLSIMTVFFACISVLPDKPACYADSSLSMGEILRRSESHYQGLKGFTADFLQLTTSAATNTITTEASGVLYYQKPRQMRWEYKAPEPQVFVANDGLAWLYVPSERQISLFDSKAFFESPLAQTFFDGISGLQKHFEVSLEHTKSSLTTAVLKLVPKKEDPNIKQLRLWIDLKTYQIDRVETQDALANTNLIMLKGQKPAPNLKSQLFQLSIPPSTLVVDTEGRELPQAEIDRLKAKLLHP